MDDEWFERNGIWFLWNKQKSATNKTKHNVSFEKAVDALFDPCAVHIDAGTNTEHRDGIIGMTKQSDLLFVVHIRREDRTIRIISARHATRAERTTYEI